MAENNAIESFGAIYKEEHLRSVNTNIMPGTLVLEDTEPFPGYLGEVPGRVKPFTIFLVTKEKYESEQIYRATQNIAKHFNHRFDAAPSKIIIHNEQYFAIRVRELESFEPITSLQESYIEEGIEFFKEKKIDARGIIKLQKHFTLEKLDEDLFRDIHELEMHYIKIPYNLKWKPFEKISKSVKNNVVFTNYDAALGVIYQRNRLDDVIRIYSDTINLDNLKELKERYLMEIPKFI